MSQHLHRFSTDQFVIRPTGTRANLADCTERLTGIARVTLLSGGKPGWLATIHQVQKSAANGWHTLRMRLGNDYLVIPVHVDREGNARYPTGMLNLRFTNGPDAALAASYAKKYQLSAVPNARFASQHISFKPNFAIDVFLPELLNAIAVEDEISEAWLDAEHAHEGDSNDQSGSGQARHQVGISDANFPV